MSLSKTKKITIAEAYQHCTDIAQNHYENFPTASHLIKKQLRPAVAAIYAFARAADDMADEGDASPEKRLKQLDAWENLLERCVQEKVDHPVFLALGDTIHTFKLPDHELHNLLIAFRMDVSIHSYATADELMFYCKHSANPVGRLMLALHGVSSSQAKTYSDAICTALQFTNFWQDLKIDIPNGRCYLPEDWLRDAGMTSNDILAEKGKSAMLSEHLSEKLRPALIRAFTETEQLYREGSRILPLLPLRLRFQVAATLHGGMAILQATKQLSDPVNTRPVLKKKDWYRLAGDILISTLWPNKKINMEAI